MQYMKHLNEYYNYNALRTASYDGDAELVRTLLQDPNIDPTLHEAVALRNAIERHHYDVIKVFMQDRRFEDILTAYIDYTVKKDMSDYEVLNSLIGGMTPEAIKFMYMNEYEFFVDENGEPEYALINKAMRERNQEAVDQLKEIAVMENPEFSIADLGEQAFQYATVNNDRQTIEAFMNDPKVNLAFKANAIKNLIRHNYHEPFEYLMSFPGMEELKTWNNFELLKRAIESKNVPAIRALFTEEALSVIGDSFENMNIKMLRIFVDLLGLESIDELETLIEML